MHPLLHLRHYLIIVVLALSGVATAQDLNSKLPSDPNVATGKLPNGLTYYIRNNKKPDDKVELRLVVKAGSILERNSQQGLAHFMEHMNFNGTTNFQKNDLVSYLQSIGVQFGADLNAYTAFDQTVYILPIPTTKPGNLEKGFQIIEDWAHNALLTGKDIDDERGVVLEESRLGKGADDRMLKKYFPKLAQGSLYADRLPIGHDEILKTFPYDTLRQFYKDWYRPDLQAVMVVGDIDVATAKKLVMEHFAGLKNPAAERARKYAGVMPRKMPEAMVVTDKEATSSVLAIMFPYTRKHPEVTVGDYRANLVRSLALQIMNRRLNDLSQGANPPFPFAQVGFDDLIHGYESFNVYAGFDNDGPQKALMAVTAELVRARQYGFTGSELGIAKKDMMATVEKAYNERNTTDSKDYVEEYIRSFLDGEPFPGIAKEYGYYQSFVPGITLKEVDALIKGWLGGTNTFTLITAPDKPEVKLPTDNELLVMTKRGFDQKVQNTTDKGTTVSLISQLPAPGKVVSQTQEEGFGATTYTLSNGIKVTIKPTTFKSDEILLTGIKKGGGNCYGVNDKANVNFAADVVDAMGLGDLSPTDLEKATAGMNMKVDMAIGEITDNIKATSTVKDFEPMLQLLYLSMERPRKDAALFAAYKEKQKTMLQFMSANPQASFIDTTVCALYGANPLRRMVIPKPEDFEHLNMDRAVEIYTTEFAGAEGYQFFIVGNVQPETAVPLLEKYLGGITATNRPTVCRDNGVRPVKGMQELKYKKGTDKKSLIVAIYSGETQYSEDLALRAQAVAEVLNIKVIQELREKLGAIYTGQFVASVSKEPYERYSVQLQLPCGPENVDKLLAAADEEIKNLKANGPDPKDLDKVKSQWKEKYNTDVKENSFWAGIMQSVVFWGRDKDRVLNYKTYVDKLTPDDVKAAANQLFNEKGNRFISILYPES
jgi:zinc protease